MSGGAALAVIVHGAHWPDAHRAAVVRDRVAHITGTAVDVVIAREDATRPRGAAACIADAVSQTSASLVLVVDSASALDRDAIVRLIETMRQPGAPTALGWIGPPLPAIPVPAPDDDPIDALMAAVTDLTPPVREDPACWAVQRAAWDALGGLDTRCWSVGAVEDLARRAEQTGWTCHPVPAAGSSTVAGSYPLHDDVRLLLAWRQYLRTCLRALPDEALGPALSVALARLLSAAWSATGLDAGALRFGGDWGQQGFGARLRSLAGQPATGGLWPRDERGTVIPLVALQSVALDLPALVAERTSTASAGRTGRTGRAGPTRGTGTAEPAGRAVAAGTAGTESGAAIAGPPRVSVLVVTWNGLDHLDACFSSILASDYPADRLEVICVDNGSTDGTLAFMADRFPSVTVVPLPENRGFTGGNVAGVARATGDVFVFLNNDMRVEPTLVPRLVDGLSGPVACAGARVMSWDGGRIDFVRGTASFEVRGFQELYQQRFVDGMALAESFFPNGGAFAVTRQAYQDAGGFDPHLFAYYDDLDLGWRLRATGVGIRTVADAVAFHRHGATSRTQPGSHKRWLMERNALWVALRNYDAQALPHVLPALLLLAGLRVAQNIRWTHAPAARRLRAWVRRPGTCPHRADVYRRTGDASPSSRVVAALPMPEFAALGAVLAELPALAAARRDVQRRRRRPDTEVLPFLGRPFEVLDGRTSYGLAQRALVDLFDLRRVIGLRTHVLLVTHEALRANVSGPAMRVLEMGRALSRTARVTIAAPGPVEMEDDRVALVPFDPAAPAALRAQADTADVVIVQGFALQSYPFLTRLVAPIVVDLYCPFTLEHLEQTRGQRPPDDPALEREARAILEVQNAQLQHGDLFLAASARQRDFWTGALHTAGRVNPRTLGCDPGLDRLVAVVPFGVSDEPIETFEARARTRRVAAGRPPGVLKGVHPAIAPDDKVLLWGGSLLDWQDPETLIEAVARLTAQRDDLRLVFMGVRHPNPQVAPMAVVERSRALARAHGLLDTHVIFNDWVPYADRGAYLLEADLGVSTHRLHLETRYAFRTRMLDYLWARLPIVCTDGDFFGDLVRARGLGRSVPAGDPDALADALAIMLDDDDARRSARAALDVVAHEMTWSRVVAPVAAFCEAPAFAADRAGRVERFHAAMATSFRTTRLLKRTLLRLGVSEGDIEHVKRWKGVQAAMTLRNKAAIWRARQRAERA